MAEHALWTGRAAADNFGAVQRGKRRGEKAISTR